MAAFLRFLLALAALPFAAALARAFCDVLFVVSSRSWLSGPAVAVGGGAFSFLLCWFFLPRLDRVYVFGHELTHAIWALAFGAKVSGLRVGASGGSVMVSKSNVWITLAPYFFPIWAVLLAVVAAVVRMFVSSLPCVPAWLFAIGFAWCFHLCFTLRALTVRQTDVLEYGRLFSWVLIFILNFTVIIVGVVAIRGVPVVDAFHAVTHETASFYRGCYELVRSLPFLR